MPARTDTNTSRRFQPPDVRRRQILDAAARLAIADGFENTSIAGVAQAAGLAKGSIYLHFESRQDLLAALQADVWAQMMGVPRAVVADVDLAWVERLDAVVGHWMRFEFENQELYHAVFHTVATDTDEPWHEAKTLLGELIDGGVTAGEFDTGTVDADLVVEFLIHAYLGPCFHHTDTDNSIAGVQELFRRVVGATSRTRS